MRFIEACLITIKLAEAYAVRCFWAVSLIVEPQEPIDNRHRSFENRLNQG
jgi:hypothetical protein